MVWAETETPTDDRVRDSAGRSGAFGGRGFDWPAVVAQQVAGNGNAESGCDGGSIADRRTVDFNTFTLPHGNTYSGE